MTRTVADAAHPARRARGSGPSRPRHRVAARTRAGRLRRRAPTRRRAWQAHRRRPQFPSIGRPGDGHPRSRRRRSQAPRRHGRRPRRDSVDVQDRRSRARGSALRAQGRPRHLPRRAPGFADENPRRDRAVQPRARERGTALLRPRALREGAREGAPHHARLSRGARNLQASRARRGDRSRRCRSTASICCSRRPEARRGSPTS